MKPLTECKKLGEITDDVLGAALLLIWPKTVLWSWNSTSVRVIDTVQPCIQTYTVHQQGRLRVSQTQSSKTTRLQKLREGAVRSVEKASQHDLVQRYAILDDQSNCSLARAEFFQLFGIRSNPSPYLVRNDWKESCQFPGTSNKWWSVFRFTTTYWM